MLEARKKACAPLQSFKQVLILDASNWAMACWDLARKCTRLRVSSPRSLLCKHVPPSSWTTLPWHSGSRGLGSSEPSGSL